jgi:hypothetical protein
MKAKGNCQEAHQVSAVAAVFDHFSFSLYWLQALAAEDTVWPFIEQR